MNGHAACKLLVVDDDQTILKLCSAALGRNGYEVSTATSGGEGLRMATETPVEVVLLDINLPDLSGLEVMRQIVKTTSKIVILITGDDYCQHKAALREGAADVIVKPFRLSDLTVRIKQALEMRHLAEAKSPMADLKPMASVTA